MSYETIIYTYKDIMYHVTREAKITALYIKSDMLLLSMKLF